MLYTIILIAFGIYIGQEYETMPSVKTMVSSSIEYFNTLNIGNVKQEQTKTMMDNIFELLSKMSKK
jgi:hypothetical protein